MKKTERIKKEIYKILYRITHSKKHHHNRKRWPYVKIKRNKNHEITYLSYKGEEISLLPLDDIRNKYSNSILLVATGPSVNEITFNEKIKIPSIGVNGAYLVNSKVDFSFYVITDIHFPDHRPDIIKEIVNDRGIILFTTVDIIIKIIDRHSKKIINCSIFIIEDLNERIYEPQLTFDEIYSSHKDKIHLNLDKKNQVGFSSDIKDGIFSGKTVVYWALQIISCLGFKKIYIIGMDMNNFEKPRFYEDEKNKIHTQLNDDMNSIIISLKHASSILIKNLGIEVVNLSPQSAIPDSIFKKSEFKNHF